MINNAANIIMISKKVSIARIRPALCPYFSITAAILATEFAKTRALIAEIDQNGNGLVEWEEYLEAMWIKRQDARKRGAGMLEFASKRAAMARKKKEDAAVET